MKGKHMCLIIPMEKWLWVVFTDTYLSNHNNDLGFFEIVMQELEVLGKGPD